MRAHILKVTICTGSVLQVNGAFIGEHSVKVALRFLAKLCTALDDTATIGYRVRYAAGTENWVIQFLHPVNESELDKMCRAAALGAGLERKQLVIEMSVPLNEFSASDPRHP